MKTSIQISEDLYNELQKHKRDDEDTFEDIIWDLLEDTMEVSNETKRNLAQARTEVENGKTRTLAEVKKELGI